MTQSKEELLNLLQSHGQDFLSSFGILPQTASEPEPKQKKRKLNSSDEPQTPSDNSSDDEEWNGFSSEGESSTASEQIEDDGREESKPMFVSCGQ